MGQECCESLELAGSDPDDSLYGAFAAAAKLFSADVIGAVAR